MRTSVTLVLLFLLAVTLPGCGAKGRTVIDVDAGSVVPGRTVFLRVRPSPLVHHNAFVLISREFHQALSDRLLAEGIFTRVVDPDETADYALDVSMEALVVKGFASGGKRDGLIHARVSLVDTASGEELKSFLAIGAGAKVAGPYGYGKSVDPTISITITVDQIVMALRGPAGDAI